VLGHLVGADEGTQHYEPVNELDVERLALALERQGTVSGIAQRYGRFNTAYWLRSAAALAAEYTGLAEGRRGA